MKRRLELKRIGGKYRLLATLDEKFLAFYCEADAVDGRHPERMANQLTKADAGQERVVDGKTYIVGGYGGTMSIPPDWPVEED